MNIKWFSPLDPQRTDIGRYSQLLLPYLHDKFALGTLTDSAEVERVFECDDAVVGMAPINIYNIGNNECHCGILHHAMREPGIIILHDVSLLELSLAFARAFPEIDLTELVSDEHGVEAAAAFDALFGGIQYSWRGESQDQYDEFVSRYQIFSSFVANASGIVVHSEYTRERVVRSYDGPVARLNLPFEPAPTWQTRRSGQPPYTILFCGHAGPNRRLLPFIETWARVSRPEMFRVSLYGNIGKVDEIMSFAADRGVAQYIELVGYVNEETLHEACLEADLALNLRYPTVGEASGSQLRFWSASLPAIVSDIGWYSELPDDVVLKVTPGDEGAGVARVLESFIDGRERYVDVGEKGYRYLCDKHSPAAYADDLYDFVAQISTQRFRQSALEGRFIDVLASMCEDVHDSHLFEATLAKLSSMVENLDSPNSDHQ